MKSRKILASIRIAFSALRINKMRSALTLLGIIIGVAAVIAMVAVGSGAEQRIKEQIASIGSNLIVVLSGSITNSRIRMGTGNAQTRTEDDARAITRECDAAALAAPTVRGGVQVVYGNSNWGTQVQGTTPAYLPIRDLAIDKGQQFTNSDVEGAAKVALLGNTSSTICFTETIRSARSFASRRFPSLLSGHSSPRGNRPRARTRTM